ncbi:LamG-like jellyroll fold domain-containing protein [Actinomadura roseirufa]|uniref:LamG-like jellyroll fold domain-containing protein n=1 Tax=Actinomadura roseirufa TaxID=2094049 RepID=UPI0010419C5A|nr:LamG-like jellyroll fold domain-containing protein [Actinomadura roseirufa]
MASTQNVQDEPEGTGTGRRAFLLGTGAIGAGAAIAATEAAAGLATAPPAAAGPGTAGRDPGPDGSTFTIAVMPDTQYLFDGDSIRPEPVEASFRHIVDRRERDNIVFVAHLGDLVQNAGAGELEAIARTFRTLDRKGMPYSVLAGNHDIDSRTDDQRGRTPYLDNFGPRRYRRMPTFGGASPDGYHTYHRFGAAGRDWLVLAMDWRASDQGFAWARNVLRSHPKTPAILTTHEIVYTGERGGDAVFSEYGERLWKELIAGNDQIFLCLNGHFWPPARTTRKNEAGNDVHVHITNYQDRYFGGAAMIRLYRFDLARDTIDVETFAPWVTGRDQDELNAMERRELILTGPDDRFSVPLDFDRRFAGFAPAPARPARPAKALLLPGTVAYWRFDSGRADGTPLAGNDRVDDLSGQGNHLVPRAAPGTPAGTLRWSSEHHPDQPGHGSLLFGGTKNPLRGAYLETEANAPLNKAAFPKGYTVEAFFKTPADWDPGQNGWAALLSRWGMAGQAGKKQGDPEEPVATLGLSPGRELQWAVYPLDRDGSVTNWGHELPLGAWWHVAVVNDGRRTTMYIDGCPVARNPATRNRGLTTLGLPWLLGGYEYGGKLDQVLHGWIGDVRVVDRALPVRDFMLT